MNEAVASGRPVGSSGAPRRRPAASGFTLIEVLITLVILSVGIVVVLRAFETSLVALGQSREALWTDLIVRERVAEMEAAARVVGVDGLRPSTGRTATPAGEFSWAVTLRERDRWVPAGEADPVALCDVWVRVRSPGTRNEREETVVLWAGCPSGARQP